MIITALSKAFKKHQEKSIAGRYILPEKLNEYLHNLPSIFKVDEIGFSVQKRPIYSVRFGEGKTKILLWSQMHGNESTTTKSLLDFFNSIAAKKDKKTTTISSANSDENQVEKWMEYVWSQCTFYCIPMLNPDGAFLWTRNNANDVDLNRDAQALSQPESKILRQVFDDFQPDVCFNLHGQRTIYGFEDTGLPSILSFLAPSADEERSFTVSRKRSASIITHIFNSLEPALNGNIGLYDDGFNDNCVGDAFQAQGTPTVLFEAGHYPDDYNREITRTYIYIALLYAIEAIIENKDYATTHYKAIPEHTKCFCDLAVSVKGDIQRIQYREELQDGEIAFVMEKLDEALSSGIFAHEVIESNSFIKFDD